MSNHRVLTIPNIISFTRLGLVGVFAALFVSGNNDLAAYIVLAVIGASDWFDGFIARKTGQVTELGKLLDPLSDRIVIVTSMLLLAFRGAIDPRLAAVILLRDLLVMAIFPILEAKKIPRLPVNRVGKAATGAIFFGMANAAASLVVPVGLGVIVRNAALGFLLLGAALYWIAGVMYISAIRRQGGSLAGSVASSAPDN